MNTIPFAEVRVGAQLFNIFLFELIGWMLYFLTGRMCFASRVLYGLAVAFGITNHYVMKFRSTPFVPWDLFSAGTAASVAGNYDFYTGPAHGDCTLVLLHYLC